MPGVGIIGGRFGGAATASSLSVSASNSTPTFGDSITFTLTPTDIIPSEYVFTFEGDVVTTATTATNTLNWTVDTFGSVTVYVQAKDGSGKTVADATPLALTISLDTDAQNYINVISSPTVNEKIKIQQLVTELKTGGVWSKLYALYPLFSDNAADQKWNMIDPQDLDASYRLTYGGGMYNSSVGLSGNDNNAYADTHFNVSTDYLSTQDASLGVYNYSQKIGNKCAAGVGFIYTVADGIMIFPSFMNVLYANAFGSSFGSVSNTNTSGLFVVTRGNATQFSYHKRGSSTIDQTVVTGMSAIPNGTIWLCAGNATIGSATHSYSDALLGYCFIGKHLTSSEIDIIYSAFETFKSCG